MKFIAHLVCVCVWCERSKIHLRYNGNDPMYLSFVFEVCEFVFCCSMLGNCLKQLKLMDLYLVLLKGTTLPIIELFFQWMAKCLTVSNIPYWNSNIEPSSWIYYVYFENVLYMQPAGIYWIDRNAYFVRKFGIAAKMDWIGSGW